MKGEERERGVRGKVWHVTFMNCSILVPCLLELYPVHIHVMNNSIMLLLPYSCYTYTCMHVSLLFLLSTSI